MSLCEIAGFDNCQNEGYSDMLGTRFFNTLCKKVLPSNLSNKKNLKNLSNPVLIRDHRYVCTCR